ncbi:MAG: ATP-grasp domain-containing protein [Lachnospiraceae bacterium]|nr:ATP-grasp domain-containing protein [Lachnospiraceae bacterium]
MNLKGKRLLILGGARLSCEIIRHAKAMGIVTAVTDWYPIEKSPAKQEADEAYFVSTSDIDAMVDLIKKEKFDGVITGFTDSVLPYYAEMCVRAGLPAYGTKEQFEIFINKERYKELMRKYDVPTIPEYRVNADRFEESAADIVYPVIVKPADSSGSRGLTVCSNAQELKDAIGFALESSKDRECLVEQYIDSGEATVFWLFEDGKYDMMLLGNRHIKHNQEGVLPLPVGYTYPASVQKEFLEKTAPKMEEMFRAVGIRDGMMFMQCKTVDGTLLVYDIGYRLTGSLEYINIKEMCGYDPMDMLIRYALTGSMGGEEEGIRVDPYLGGAFSYNVSLLCKPGKIAKITGLREIRRLPGVIDVVVAHPEGEIITEDMRGLLAQITIRVLGRADSVSGMKDEILKIQELARVISEDGEDMILPGMEESDFVGTIYEK